MVTRTRTRNVAAFASVAAATGAFAVACQIVAGIERVAKDDAPAPAADAAVDAAPLRDPCAHVLPPPPPAQDDDRDTKTTFFVAVRTAAVAGLPDASLPGSGYDLDRVCTCDTRLGAAYDGGSSCAPLASVCDEDGGIDIGATHFFENAVAGLPVDTDKISSINASVDAGRTTILLFIADYNGKANDLDVTVGTILSNGLVDPSGCGSPGSGPSYPPQWCGKDRWSYPPGALVPGIAQPTPLFRGHAYVNDFKLVFATEDTSAVPFASRPLRLGDPLFVATISKSAAGLYQLDGTLSGRVPVVDLIGALATVSAPDLKADGGRMCHSAFFTPLRDELCRAVDIASSSAFDFQPGRCDALSTSLAFHAEQAEIGAENPNGTDAGDCETPPPGVSYSCDGG